MIETMDSNTHPKRRRPQYQARRLSGVALVVVSALLLSLAPPVPHADAAPSIAGWRFLHDDGHLHYACQRAVNSPEYGPLWEVRTLTIDRPGGHDRHKPWYRTVHISAIRWNSTRSWKNNDRWLGALNGNTILLSRHWNEKLWIQTDGYGPYNPRFTPPFDPATFPRCR